MRVLALALVACALPSVARAESERCVTYVTVPDGIEDVIDGWVAAEPRCHGSIKLRVIPTADGLFLFAERPDGTVHERLVPDLTAAGVLVASWVSDAWRDDRPRRKKAHKRKRPIQIRAVAVDEANAVEGGVVLAEPARERKRWISFGITTVPNVDAEMGFRAELDVIAYRGWKLGVAAQKVVDTVYDASYGDQLGLIEDWSAGAIVSHTLRWRDWELRGGAGVYVLRSHLDSFDFRDTSYPYTTYDISLSPMYELSLTLGRDIGDRWGLGLTLAATYISQDWVANDNMTWNHQTPIVREYVQPIVVASLRRRI